MQSNSDMQQGWDFAAGIMSDSIAVQVGYEHVKLVENAIDELERGISEHQYTNLDINHLQGYMLEEYAAGTFNIDAIASGSTDRATVLHSNDLNSIDVQLDSGKAFSAKSYLTADKTVKAQSKLDPLTQKSSYHNQERLVPTDQLEDAKSAARRLALKNKDSRPDLSKSYAETESKLTDTISNKEGVKSKKVSRSELEDIAKEAKNKEFKAEKHGITADSAIKVKYALQQSLKAGGTAAAISVAVKLAPEIFKAIDYLIKNGELEPQQLKKMGTKAMSASAEGFLRGSISCFLMILCEKGTLGESLKAISPTMLGASVVLIMQTVKNSILVAAGYKSPEQMGSEFVDTVAISSSYMLGAKIGGAVGQALGFSMPVFGYLVGSLVGTSFSIVYNIGKKKLISFCADTGFTCFGLVEQNYELPEEIINELGIDTIPIPRTQIEQISIPTTQIMAAQIEQTQYETIDITVLRRGVIGVNKIGYTFK